MLADRRMLADFLLKRKPGIAKDSTYVVLWKSPRALQISKAPENKLLIRMSTNLKGRKSVKPIQQLYEGGLLFWREMLLIMMKVFDTNSFMRAHGTKGETKGDMTKTVNKHVKCRQHFSPEKKAPSYVVSSFRKRRRLSKTA